MSTKRSRVHPPYKTKYRVTNWPSYNQALVDRGDLRLWISPDAIANWNAKPKERRRGGQPKYSNLAIETDLTLRLIGNRKNSATRLCWSIGIGGIVMTP